MQWYEGADTLLKVRFPLSYWSDAKGTAREWQTLFTPDVQQSDSLGLWLTAEHEDRIWTSNVRNDGKGVIYCGECSACTSFATSKKKCLNTDVMYGLGFTQRCLPARSKIYANIFTGEIAYDTVSWTEGAVHPNNKGKQKAADDDDDDEPKAKRKKKGEATDAEDNTFPGLRR